MTTTGGRNYWVNDIERADDGDPASGTTWHSIDELAHRTTFLQFNSQLAIANHRIAKLAASADSYTGIAHGVGAGPFDRGLFVAVGRASAGGAAFALSVNGEDWYDYTESGLSVLGVPTTLIGVAHGGDGAVGSRSFAFCGYYTDGGNERPCIFTTSDAADENVNPFIPEFDHIGIVQRYAGTALVAHLRSIAWNGTVFCAVGDDGLIVTLSSDLATDTVRTPGSSYEGAFHHVFADSNGRLFALGEAGEIQRSTDHGVTWARVHADSSLGILTSGVAITIAGAVSLVVGTSDENKVLRSTNTGTSWTEVELIPEAAFDGAEVLVFRLGVMLCAILRSETHDGLAAAI